MLRNPIFVLTDPPVVVPDAAVLLGDAAVGPPDPPVVLPDVRVTAIVAAGNAQVAIPPWVSVNFTGTTPRLTLNTLVPLALIGC